MRVKTESRRQHILTVAGELFGEMGFENSSMNELARRVGFSKATLYNYFRSKEEVFISVMEESARHHLKDTFEVLNSEAPFPERLQAFAYGYIESIVQPNMVSLKKTAQYEAHRSDVGKFFYQHGPLKGLNELSDFFAAQMQAGALRPAPADICARHFMALLDAEYEDPLFYGVIDLPPVKELHAAADRAIDVFMRAYSTAS